MCDLGGGKTKNPNPIAGCDMNHQDRFCNCPHPSMRITVSNIQKEESCILEVEALLNSLIGNCCQFWQYSACLSPTSQVNHLCPVAHWSSCPCSGSCSLPLTTAAQQDRVWYRQGSGRWGEVGLQAGACLEALPLLFLLIELSCLALVQLLPQETSTNVRTGHQQFTNQDPDIDGGAAPHHKPPAIQVVSSQGHLNTGAWRGEGTEKKARKRMSGGALKRWGMEEAICTIRIFKKCHGFSRSLSFKNIILLNKLFTY